MSEEPTIYAPGVYSDISNDEYHSSAGVSKSGIPLLLRSPNHYWSNYLDPDREHRVETKAFKIGSAGHKLVLEPDAFYEEYKVLPENIDSLNGNTKIKKEYIAALNAQGKTDLKISEFQEIDGMAIKVFEHPEAGPLLTGGLAEHSFFWIDSDTGVRCKCRPDYWLKGLALPDYKTTEDARPGKFSKSCADYTYDIQAAFYSDGVNEVTGEQLDMPFIAQEKSKPYALNVFFIDPADVNYARTQYKRALEIFATCQQNDYWPSYPSKIQTISLPAWSRK